MPRRLTPSEYILLKCIAKELAHILQKSEGLLEFGFLPLLGAFLGVEVVLDDILNTRTNTRTFYCLQTDTCNQLNKHAICRSNIIGPIELIGQGVELLVTRR